MPTYRSINIALHSQFDIETLPEYYPDPKEQYIARGITGFVPEVVDDKISTCSTYIPVLPGSTFWIDYSVSPPVPDGQLFLFKLYVNGAHIISWSTGKKQSWKGKTMYGLFARSKDQGDNDGIEKRVLCFTSQDPKDIIDTFDDKACMEIKIHRAKGRQRIDYEAEEYEQSQHAQYEEGINLVNAGLASAEHPKRFYKFALIDPTDQPFATFRYYYRTWDQLRALGLLKKDCDGVGEENELPVIEPQDSPKGIVERVREAIRCHQSDESDDEFHDCGHNSINRHVADEHSGTKELKTSEGSPTKPDIRRRVSNAARGALTSGSTVRRVSDSIDQPLAYIPRGASSPETDATDEMPVHQRDSFVSTPPHLYRGLLPPPVKLEPPKRQSRRLPSLPQKRESSLTTSYRPHPAYPVNDWIVRTPSPVKSIRESLSTPPLAVRKNKARSASALMNAITSTFKRRGTPSSEAADNAGNRAGARSASS